MFFIYGAENSKACDKAEFLLHTLSIQYRFYVFGRDYSLQQLQKLVPETVTVPHIFHGTKYIGGVRELALYLQNEEVLYESRAESERSKRVFTLFDERWSDKGNVHKE